MTRTHMPGGGPQWHDLRSGPAESKMLQGLRGRVSEDLRRLVLSTLEVDPANRPSAADILELAERRAAF